MEPKHSNDSQRRIADLQSRGRLAPTEAAALQDAFRSAEEPAPATPAPQSVPDFAHVFLSGGIDETTLRTRTRGRAVQMGLMFGGLFTLGMLLTSGWNHPWWQRLAVWIPGGALAGALFGWMMHRTVLLPAVERLVRLRREAGTLQPIGFVDAGQCPTCRGEDFEVWTWRKPIVLHYIVNPALAFNELVLGQRIPANTKVCRHCHSYAVDCPNCRRAIDCIQWGGRRAFLHWRALPCPFCGGTVPTLSNALAYVVKAPFRLVAKLFGQGGAA